MSGRTQKRHRLCAHVFFDCGSSTERCRRPHSERLCSAEHSPKDQVSRERHELTGVSLTPKDESTLAEIAQQETPEQGA